MMMMMSRKCSPGLTARNSHERWQTFQFSDHDGTWI